MQVLLIAAITANGQIAQNVAQSSLDWTSKEDKKFFSEKTKEVGVVIMGRKTFETIGRPLKDRKLIVLTEKPGEIMEGVEYVNKPVKELLDDLGVRGIARVVIGGGSNVYSTFLREGLVTDVYLTIESLLFGQGIPLASGFDRIDMSLAEVTRLGEGTVLLHYTIK
jgi:dihydrofolate reductase